VPPAHHLPIESDSLMQCADDASGPILLGLEIGESGTHFAAYRETASGPIRRMRHSRAPAGPEEALSLIRDLLVRTIYDLTPEEQSTGHLLPPLRLGIAFWGQLDRDRQLVLQLRQNESWSGFPLADALSASILSPSSTIAALETAINAAAWCEAASLETSGPLDGLVNGASSSSPSTVLYVHIGREVSAATVQDGKLLVRHSQSEERFGHTTVAALGPRCRCGGYGHLTPIASAGALVRGVIGRSADDDQSLAAVLRMTGGRAEALTAPQVVKLATGGNAIAADILTIAQDALSLAIGNALLILAPDEVVIGGPLTVAGEAFLQPLRDRLALLLGASATVPTVRMGRFEPFSVLRGAYTLARDRKPRG
jgi:glucokinase